LEEERKVELEAIKKAAKARGADRPSASTNPVFQQLKISLAESEANVASLRGRVTELSSRVEQLRSMAARVPQIEAEMTQMNRDYDVLRRNYEQLVARREAASMSEDVEATSKLGEFRLIDPPRVSPKPVFPNRLMLVPLALAIAVGAGAFASFAVSQILPTVQDARMLRGITNRPLLGSVSLIWTDAAARRSRKFNTAFGGGLLGLFLMYGAWLTWISWLALRG
jgi:polysaccharide chain length determinant protein (PEP-CTERM system associated)